MKNVQAARDEIEAKWKKGIRPVEWSSQEEYEKIKQQYYRSRNPFGALGLTLCTLYGERAKDEL